MEMTINDALARIAAFKQQATLAGQFGAVGAVHMCEIVIQSLSQEVERLRAQTEEPAPEPEPVPEPAPAPAPTPTPEPTPQSASADA